MVCESRKQCVYRSLHLGIERLRIRSDVLERLLRFWAVQDQRLHRRNSAEENNRHIAVDLLIARSKPERCLHRRIQQRLSAPARARAPAQDTRGQMPERLRASSTVWQLVSELNSPALRPKSILLLPHLSMVRILDLARPCIDQHERGMVRAGERQQGL